MHKFECVSRQITCPVCCGNHAHHLWGTSSRQAAQHFVLREQYPERFSELVLHIENLWEQNVCEIVQCDNCEFIYCNPFIAGDERFYNLAYGQSSGYPSWKWEFQLTYDVLRERSRSDMRLLEIGAGDGAFVTKIASDVLPKENVVCTEFSRYGKSQIEKCGIKCISEDVRNVSDAELKGGFDIVCMFQVLEHMDRLDVLFQKLHWLMKIGGSLFIAVPNGKVVEFNELNDGLLEMPPNHVGRWNKKCFEEIGRQNGFHIEDYRVEKSGFIAMAKGFAIYRFLRRSQRSGSFENRIHKIKNLYLLRILQVIGAGVNLMMAIPALAKMNHGMGNSQWVHFIKVKQ